MKSISARAEYFEYGLKYFAIFLIVGFAATGIIAARGLFADGANFLLQIFHNHNFFSDDKPRYFAQIITQAPVVLAIKAGIRDINILIRLHSFGVIALPLFFWIIALIVQLRYRLFWLFLAAFSLSYLNSGFFAIGEYNLAYSMTGLCAAILLKDKLGVLGTILLILTSFLLTRTYEAMVFLGPLLFAIAISRVIIDKNSDSLYLRSAIVVSAFFFAASSAISAWSIMFPRYPPGLAGAMNLRLVIFSKQFIYLALMSIAFLICLVLKSNILRNVSFLLALIVSAVFIARPNYWFEPFMHFNSRFFSGLCLFALILLMAVCFFYSKKKWYFDIQGNKSPLIVLLIFITLSIQLFTYTSGFYVWAKNYEAEVLNRSGLVPIENTSISKPIGNAVYTWIWANPSLSMLLRINNVGAIILNERDYQGWQPFDPSKIDKNFMNGFNRVSRLYP
jgi:hypothetical protein